MPLRQGIALLITVMFVMVISVAIGYNLLQVKNASHVVQKEKQLYQNTMLLDDILRLVQNSPELQTIGEDNASNENLYIFLSTLNYIPLQVANMHVELFISSARSKVNINELERANEAYFREFFAHMMLSNSYVDVLKDAMSKFQAKNEYNSYNSVIFDANPYLFRDYIASREHLDIINSFYRSEYNDENIDDIDFAKLFRFSADMSEKVDLNYASVEALMLLLNTTKERAQAVYAMPKPFRSVNDMGLNANERAVLSKFKTSFFEPYLHVEALISNDEAYSKVSFDYDIRSKKGSNFVFDI